MPNILPQCQHEGLVGGAAVSCVSDFSVRLSLLVRGRKLPVPNHAELARHDAARL